MTLATWLSRLPGPLAEQLRAVIEADTEHPDLHPTPWQAAVVMRFGAVLGGAALISCLGVLLAAAFGDVSLVLALALSGGGLAVHRNATRQLYDMMRQFGLVLQWTALGLFAVWGAEQELDPVPFAALWCVWEGVAIALWRDDAQRGLSAAGLMGGLAVLVGYDLPPRLYPTLGLLPLLGALGLWAAHGPLARRGYTAVVDPVASMWTVIALYAMVPGDLVGLLVDSRARSEDVVAVVSVASLVGVVGWLMTRPELARMRPALAALALALIPAGWQVPGIASASALGLLTLARGRPALAGAAVVALAGYTVWLYYSFNLSFGAKAAWMAATGVALWAASWLVPADDTVEAR